MKHLRNKPLHHQIGSSVVGNFCLPNVGRQDEDGLDSEIYAAHAGD